MSKNIFRRTISYIIAISFVFSYIVYAEEIITQETDQSEFSYEPEIHVEEVDHWILLGDEDEAVDKGTPPKRAPGARAVSSSCSSYWQYLLSQQFGDEYLSPALVTDGVSVNGVTNRMTISENDLTLPGRHGLNVELIREYDSQRTEAEWRAERNDIALTASHRWIMYTFTDENSGNTYNIAVESEDDYYVFNMDAGIYLTKIDTRYILKKKVDDGFVYFYRFSDLYSYQTNDESAEYHLIPIANSRWNFTYSERESALYSLKSSRVRYSGVDLGMGWSIKLPYAYQLRSEYNRYASSSYTDYESRFNGVFRTIQGELVTFAGYTLVRNKNDGTATFTSSYNTENNRFCNITTYYEEQQLDDSPELLYNFKVYDSRGFTYYLKSVASVLHDSTMKLIAIENKFGDRITYTYDGSLSCITDTYGREINFNYGTDAVSIGYNNGVDADNKTITYSKNAYSQELNNQSPLTGKTIYEFTVTNEEGEQTKYYERETENAIFATSLASAGISDYSFSEYETSDRIRGYILEKILYPGGGESHFKYARKFIRSKNLNVIRSAYAVVETKDIENGTVKNNTSYAINSGSFIVTAQFANGSTLERTYNSEWRMRGEEFGGSSGYIRKYYSYDKFSNIIQVNESVSGVSKTYSYTYTGAYGDLKSREIIDSKKEIAYTYHSVDGLLTNVPESITYKYNNQIDYIINTTLTSDNKNIEYERVTQNNQLKAQTKYTYNADGDLIKTDIWRADTDGDGDLDYDDEYASVSASRVVSDSGLVSVTESITGILDADNAAAGNISNTYQYNVYGMPISCTDSTGNITSIDMDSQGRITGYHYPNNSQKTAEYDLDNNCVTITDITGAKTKVTFTPLGKLQKKERLEGETWQLLTQNSYDSSQRLASSITYMDENTGKKEEYEYDGLDRITKKRVYELPSTLLYTENYAYVNVGNELRTTVTTAAADNTQVATVIQKTDSDGNITEEKSESGSTAITKTYTYDYRGNKLTETFPKGGTITYTYDYANKLLSTTDELGNVTSNTYDMAGNLIAQTDANGAVTNYEYDKAGRKIRDTLPAIGTTAAHIKYYYDSNSRVIKQSTEQTANVYADVEYTYDVMGNVVKQKEYDPPNNRETVYTYDTANRVTCMSYGGDADSSGSTYYMYDQWGNTTAVNDVSTLFKTTVYSNFDYEGNPRSVTDRNENVLSYQYGIYGVKQVSGPGRTINYSYNNMGYKTQQSVTETGNNATESYTYDPFGRMLTYSTAGTVQNYTYDNNSNVLTHTFRNASGEVHTESYTYNAKNQLTQAESNGIINTYTYDANGNLTGKAAETGTQTAYTYNDCNQITSMINKKGSTIYNNYQCGYNLNGLKTAESDSTSDYLRNYTYDLFGRLTAENYTVSSGSQTNMTYSYDAGGNRTDSAKTLGETVITENYGYRGNNSLAYRGTAINGTPLTGEFYHNDGNGNLTDYSAGDYELDEEAEVWGVTNSDEFNYTYNEFNQLISYTGKDTTAAYTYNASGLRNSKTVNGVKTEFIWNGNNLVYEKTGTKENYYSYDVTGISNAEIDGAVTGYLKDSHGNVTAKTTADGEIVKRYEYEAFGTEYARDGNDTNPFRYCGEYYDSETELIYLRNRYYDSTLGRFISEDPARDGTNWYVYCENNPVGFIDPLGLFMTLVGTTEEKNLIYKNLKMLTRDDLGYNETDGGNWLVHYTAKSGSKYNAGTQLIRRIIDNAKGCIINITPYEENKSVPIDYDNASVKGIGSGGTIYYNPHVVFKNVLTEYKSKNGNIIIDYQEMPSEIILGHELIHMLRAMNGNRIALDKPNKNNLVGKYRFVNSDNQVKSTSEWMEELATTGISYSRPDGSFADAANWVTTENALRKEHGYGRRVKY